MKKFLIAGAIALAAAPLAVAGFAGANPGNPQGGNASTVCDGTPVAGDAVLAWNPTNLWPPNHKPRTINITYTDPDGTGAGQISIDVGQIVELPPTTDESGAGHTSQDFTGANTTGASVPDNQTAVPSQPVTLLSERSGHDMAGRTYMIPVTCHDGAFSAMANICVTVPHDQHHAVVQDPTADCAVTTATG